MGTYLGKEDGGKGKGEERGRGEGRKRKGVGMLLLFKKVFQFYIRLT